MLRDGVMTLGVNSSALARLGTRRSRSGRFAALSVRVPLPIGRAGWNRSWWRMLRNTAALLSRPIPVGGAVVSARRERWRWVSVRKATRTTSPPPFVGTAVIIVWWWSSRWTTRVCASPKIHPLLHDGWL
ncbi:unnamed protein product [Rhizoctonia solani]|uniref:Uncharacterized protein n=1 Tax=Rhizoctonia solani TaxID=456999 RepID=A0A8H2XTZ0_9AGAM|nr:unnamed protein product [Rhizoctonia solani]